MNTPPHDRRRRCLPLLVLAALWLPAAAFAHDEDGPDRAFFRVGAAAVDVTPPPFGQGENPAACAGASNFTGPHLFSLEEPYTDTNGNGRYDPGEPFLDCPTPRADGGTRPPDGRWDGIYLGGGNSGNRLPTAVLDPLWARTIVVSDGHKTISLTSVDNEGVFKEIWDRVRAKVAADGVLGLDEMVFTSTHDESAPDTIGISGPDQFTSGSNPFYVEFLIERTARSIEDAFAGQRRATLRFGQVHPDDLIPCWSSYPYAADEQIGVMQAEDRHGHVIATLVNYGIHAEELGFSDDSQDRLHLSSDWHHFARKTLESRYGGVAMTMAGAVGSVEMPQVYPSPRDFTPVDLYSSSGNGGCRTIYATDNTRVPYGYELSTRSRGERIATWAETALKRGHVSRSSVIDARRKTFFVPLENALFAAGAAFGVLPEKDAYLDGQKLSRLPDGFISPLVIPNQFVSDALWLRIGDAEFVNAPGEVFPYTYVRDFGGAADQAVPDGAAPPDWVMPRLSQPFRFIIGLGDDMIGYIFPKTNAVAVPMSFDNISDVDRFGCSHPDDGEAAATEAGDLVVAALVSILPKSTSDDVVRTGRYVWRDGTLHRSPLGEGGQACQGPGNTFVAAPGGAATEVWILPPGTTQFAPHVGERITVEPEGWWRWMDLRGRPQQQPSTQTRGVIDRDDRRIWLDVFPETSGP
ncbi:MAG TPA: hypothetical protein VK714_07645 [Myxococcota bacterium]|nr:hypothetical protein [Myxococcota bacterium]